jgi:FG-GAP repeat protein
MKQNASLVGLSGLCLLVLGISGAGAQCLVSNAGSVQLASPVAPDGHRSVARDGDVAVVGAIHDGTNGLTAGAVLVYRLADGIWDLEATLIPSNIGSQDHFGSSVAIEGNTIVAGADHEDTVGIDSGAAYVFTYDGSSWTQQARLEPLTVRADHRFGTAVGIADGQIMVGAPGDDVNERLAGAVYVYTGAGSSWTVTDTLRPADNDTVDFFGWSISMDGSRAAIGAFDNELPGGPPSTLPGSAYIYEREASGWIEKANLFPPASALASTGAFGASVGLSGDQLIVGAPNSSAPGGNAGAAFVYRFDGANWDDGTALVPPNTLQPGDRYGQYVAIDGTVAVVDAKEGHFFPNPPGPGHVYVFTRSDGTWIFETSLAQGVDAFVAYSSFGISPVLMGNDMLVVTGAQDLNTGAVGQFLVSLDLGCVGTGCPPDLNNDGVLDFFDVQAFLTAFAAMDPSADFNDDGFFNFFDVSTYLAAFSAGCP